MPSSNVYLDQFASMVASSSLVKHSVLSLASSYVLDFKNTDKMIARANLHHRQAIGLVGRSLNDPDTYLPGKEDAVLAAIAIMAHNEVGQYFSIGSQSP